jgi:hypothetical protein
VSKNKFVAKIRTTISSDLSAETLFASDRTCCVCRERGRPIQIHHIDENPANNVIKNLSVLCLECHNETQIKGGFSRKLNAPVVIKFRDEWLETVQKRRNLADEIAVKRQVGETSLSQQVENYSHRTITHSEPEEPPIDYINALPELKKALLRQAKPKWDTAVTTTVVQASYDYIDSLTSVLITLAKYFSPVQFGIQSPNEYFSEIISSRFLWHRTLAEPYGPGTGGTIVNINVCGGVISDVEKMVEDVVMALVGYDETFDWRGWSIRWRKE